MLWRVKVCPVCERTFMQSRHAGDVCLRCLKGVCDGKDEKEDVSPPVEEDVQSVGE